MEAKFTQNLLIIAWVLFQHTAFAQYAPGSNPEPAVSVSVAMPTAVAPGESFVVTITLTKGRVNGFAKLENILPPGLQATAIDRANSTFSFKDRKVKFLWMALPAQSTFTVSYNLVAASYLSGKQIIEGTFAYIDDNETRKYILPKATIEIITQPHPDANKMQVFEYKSGDTFSDTTAPLITITSPKNIKPNNRLTVQDGVVEIRGNANDLNGVYLVKINNRR